MKTFKDFLKEKNVSEDDFATKSPEEMADLYNEYNQACLKEINDNVDGKADKSEIPDMKEALKGFIKQEDLNDLVKTKAVNDLKEIVKNLGEDVTAIKTAGSQKPNVSFSESIASALAEKHEDLKKFFKANEATHSGSFEIQVKAPALVTTGNVTPTGAADIYAAQSVTSVSAYERGDIFLEQYLDTGNTKLASIPFVDELPGEGDAAIVAEGSLKPLIDVDYVTAYSQARKVAGRMKATEEALYDYGWLESAMTTTLKKKHDIARQNDLIGATNGIQSIATAFNPTILGGVTVTAPQYYDAIAALVAGIANNSQGYYVPNVIFVNTLDNLTKMLTKDDNKNYVMPPFADANGNIIEGVRVVARPSITPGSFIIGDFKNVKLRNLWGYTVRFGWENDDFGKNQITMVGESRYHLYATTNDKRGIIKGTFADVIAALTV